MKRRQLGGLNSSVKRSFSVLAMAVMLSTLICHRHTNTDRRRTEEFGSIVDKDTPVSVQIQPPRLNFTITKKPASRDASQSPVCYPFASLASTSKHGKQPHGHRTINRIYFAHMRKAGGTTLRTYLAAVAQQYGLELVISEGGHFEPPGSNDRTLYVTHLRDPYRRSISHFQYEVRWPCEQLLQNDSFVPSLDNAANLTAWIAEPAYRHPSLANDNTTTRPRCDDTQAYLVDCSTNCYIRWMNYPSGSCSRKVFHRNSVHYHKALQQLRQYDVIIDIDRLFSKNHPDDMDRDPGSIYAASLEEFFGLQGIRSENRPMYCLRHSRNANRRFPLQVDNATRELFYERNQADYDMYHELVDCQTASKQIKFPRSKDRRVTLADFVESSPAKALN